MTSQPLITISIVSHGDAKRVDNLLASLQKFENNISQIQVILTDNLGNDLPEFDPAPWASMRILRNGQQQGFARNHNRAFEFSQGIYFAILNPDLKFDSPVFERLIARLHDHHAELIAPQIVDENGVVQDSFRSMPTPFEIIRRRLPGYKFKTIEPENKGTIHPDWVAGMFWLMKAESFRRLGGMDERYRLYFEDVDFCARARLEGMRLLVDAEVRVRHDAQRSSRKSPYYLFLHIQSAVRFFMSPIYRQFKRLLQT